jgi:tetratricopeptide (TPR) repeat protein
MTGGGHDPGADAAHWSAVEEASELMHEERFRDAIVEIRRLLQEDPRNPYAYHLLGMAFFEVGELEPARDAYRACLRLAPKHLGARVALSHLLRATGDVKAAIREGQIALEQSPGDLEALLSVGLAYHAYGDDAATRRYLEAYLAREPEYETATEIQAILATLPGGPEAPEDDD